MNKWATDWASEEDTGWVSVYGCRLRFVWGCWFICLNVQSLQTTKTASHWFLKPAQPCRSHQDEQNKKNNDNVNKHFLICTVKAYYGLWDCMCALSIFDLKQTSGVWSKCLLFLHIFGYKTLPCSTGTAPCPSLSHTPVGIMCAQWITSHCVALVLYPVPSLSHTPVGAMCAQWISHVRQW